MINAIIVLALVGLGMIGYQLGLAVLAWSLAGLSAAVFLLVCYLAYRARKDDDA